MNYLFTNILGSFVFDNNIRLIDKALFDSLEDYQNRDRFEKKLKAKHKRLEIPEGKKLSAILDFFRDKRHFGGFYQRNMEITVRDVKGSVSNDLLIIQAINSIEDLTKAINMLITRLREWYSLHNPEFSNSVESHEKFIELVVSKDKKELLRSLGVKESMGADLSKENLAPIMSLAKEIKSVFELKEKQERYLESIMKKGCANMLEITGVQLGAKLIEYAGSLKQLVLFPASTIQLLGAEKALFRHIKNKKNLCPKYGILHEHPLVIRSKKKNQGKAARIIADKISIAVKVDYFKGKFIGDKLRKEVEKKIKGSE